MKVISLCFICFFASIATAQEVTLCEDKGCNRHWIIFDDEKGAGLIDFQKYDKDKLAPAKLNQSDRIPFPGSQKKGLDLRWSDLSEGMCLIDPIAKVPIYYKINKLEESEGNQVAYYVIEAENHENSLKANFIFFDSAQSGAFRKLRKIQCSQTPHLYDEKYIIKCLEGSKAGTHLCDYDSFVR